MSRKELPEIAQDATRQFGLIADEVERLAFGESDFALNMKEVQDSTRTLREQARQTSASLNRAAPMVESSQLELFRGVSLMLSEISTAERPEIFFERFHARREEIEAGLEKLSS